jgi:hypothetical protein
MGIIRRGLAGGAVAGLGNALAGMADARIKRRELATAAAIKQDELRQQALAQLGANIAQNPTAADLQLQMAGNNPLLRGLNLSSYKPSDEVLLRGLTSKIAGADKELDLQPFLDDPAAIAKQFGVNAPSAVTPKTDALTGAPMFDGIAEPGEAPATVTTPNAKLQGLLQQAEARKAALKQAQEDALVRAGILKREEAHGTATGTAAAAHENAPTALQDDLAKLNAEGPVQAQNAGLTAGATFDAQHTPDRVKADANAAGMKAGSEEHARLAQQLHGSGLSQQAQQAALQLGDDFRAESQNFRIQEGNFRTILGSAKDPSAAGDLSIIFAYMKLLDPTSSVREGEQATAANAAGIPAQVRNYWNRVNTGERLAPAQREDFLKKSFSIYTSALSGQKRTMADYLKRATTLGVPPELVIGRGTDPTLEQNPVPPKGSTLDSLLKGGQP